MRSYFLLVLLVLGLLVAPGAFATDDSRSEGPTLSRITYSINALWGSILDAADQVADRLQIAWDRLGPTLVPVGDPEPTGPPTDEPTDEMGPTIVPVG